MLTEEERKELIELGIDPDRESTEEDYDRTFDWEDEE